MALSEHETSAPPHTAGRQGAVGLGAVVAAAGTAAACAACCVLPIAVPALALAGFGGVIAAFAGARPWLGPLAAAGVAVAWLWVGWDSWRTRRRPARATAVLMLLATALLAIALLWPRIEPLVLAALRRG